MDKTIELLLNHKSIRKYTDQKISQETIEKIVSCAQMAPSSSHFQAYTIIEVKDFNKRNLLAEWAGGQKWVEDASLVLLFCGDLYRACKYYEDIDKDILSNTEAYTVATVDTALAAQKAFIAAQSLGLGGVCVGGIRNEVEKISKEFGLPYLVFPLFLLCLGYPDDDPEIKPRLPMGIVHKIDFYDESKDDQLMKEYNKTISDYYHKRTKGEEKDRWTERCGKYLMEKPRYNVGDYFRKIGLLKK
ncbi:oxygen-insensitive NADPH nitroreductase [Tissierella sp. Yu-01]|uniref:oxygen-insensitive NADPH nitroreductase n=1 Tax=Tissierella sp. Yu-01 TaxID=3035694 RepID=UPI00240D874D|nr:oxygen-insensitive NADPH nitroreductase [Tissierella sp. Yu-01]WFA08973.1 oxygen-insensitive NADPH nitroreductase [Tissierella sp. Yu-01]WFA08995.1 oxygen-insensitive NADPH nitroreductase [Tissierella sp. Yu-01]